ncbi:MAG TPA: hypothetical protein VGO18_30905 [Steroidobacteraceae bacterium]|nr:hypothetical protein [Steroidobacteraceae bacterium]
MQDTLPLAPTGLRRIPILRELLPPVRGHLRKRFVHCAQKLVNLALPSLSRIGNRLLQRRQIERPVYVRAADRCRGSLSPGATMS